eukprot:2416938-Rhodomonas_salina.3
MVWFTASHFPTVTACGPRGPGALRADCCPGVDSALRGADCGYCGEGDARCCACGGVHGCVASLDASELSRRTRSGVDGMGSCSSMTGVGGTVLGRCEKRLATSSSSSAIACTRS